MHRRSDVQTMNAHAERPRSNGEPRQRRLLILRTRLAGARFHVDPETFDQLRPGDALTLTREPENPHDLDAIRADWRGRPIGYLPSDHNYAPARLLDQGERLEARIGDLDIEQRPKWPLEIDVFLKLPVAISAGNASFNPWRAP